MIRRLVEEIPKIVFSLAYPVRYKTQRMGVDNNIISEILLTFCNVSRTDLRQKLDVLSATPHSIFNNSLMKYCTY